MSIVTFNTKYKWPLPEKFQQHILSKDSPSREMRGLYRALHHIFSKNSSESFSSKGFHQIPGVMKDHIFTHEALPGWVCKVAREDGHQHTLDQHIYRVRKAAKLRKLVDENNCRHIKVPKKYLFPYVKDLMQQWMVVAERIDLKYDNTSQYTTGMVRELALLIFKADLSDIDHHNLPFATDGKVALIDTEPTHRGCKKRSTLINQKAVIKFRTNLYCCRRIREGYHISEMAKKELDLIIRNKKIFFAVSRVLVYAIPFMVLQTRRNYLFREDCPIYLIAPMTCLQTLIILNLFFECYRTFKL